MRKTKDAKNVNRYALVTLENQKGWFFGRIRFFHYVDGVWCAAMRIDNWVDIPVSDIVCEILTEANYFDALKDLKPLARQAKTPIYYYKW